MTAPSSTTNDAEEKEASDAPRWRVWLLAAQTRALHALPFAIPTAWLARSAIAGTIAKVGHPGAPLDDSYIHFQYARAIAEGHPFRYQAGEAITSGGTSFLWPALLAPFYLVGFRGESIMWPAWALSFIALGMLSYEAYALAKRMTGTYIAAGAAAMVLMFGGFVWCAASGMEVVPFAWAFARAVRRASEWRELEAEKRTAKRAAELIALAWVATLFRPEGALAAIFVAASLAVFPKKKDRRAYLLAAGAAAAAIATPLLLLALTGSTKSNTTVVKLMVGNPYYQGDALVAAVESNAQTLVKTILNGEVWSAEFVPKGGEISFGGHPIPIGAMVAMGGLIATAIVGWKSKSAWRAGGVLLIALAMFAPCFYVTFLWNRLRYLWPFATGWLIGLACLARLIGDAFGGVRPRWRAIGAVAAGIAPGLLASRLDWVLDDVAQSASGIDRQQAALGRWAQANLPADARIGVNDTGAIAYFGDRHTFDVVGLTSEGEARYWVAGAGSRLEHYERLQKTAPSKLPTHFIVYPEWMACEAVLGRQLHEAVVTDASILGGQSMRVYEASYKLLGTGEMPWSAPDAQIVDAIDVADLESEADHAYELLGARDGEEVARMGVNDAGTLVADGGRTNRLRERFVAKLKPGISSSGIVRLEASSRTTVRIKAGGKEIASFVASPASWKEYAFDIPASVATPQTQFEVQMEDGSATVFHYWMTAAP